MRAALLLQCAAPGIVRFMVAAAPHAVEAFLIGVLDQGELAPVDGAVHLLVALDVVAGGLALPPRAVDAVGAFEGAFAVTLVFGVFAGEGEVLSERPRQSASLLGIVSRLGLSPGGNLHYAQRSQRGAGKP